MSSSEEYLENLLQAMMTGAVAGPSIKDMDNSERPKSAIEMLTGEEPEQAEPDIALSENLGISLDDTPEMVDSVSQDILESEAFDVGSESFEETGMDEISIEESDLGEISIEESDLGEISIEEPDLGEISIEESDLGEISVEEPELEGILSEEPEMTSIELDNSELNDIAVDENGFDDIALEESGMDEMLVEESNLDDITLDGAGLDDVALEESGLDDIALEESGLDDITLEEPGLDDIALEESGLDDIALEESGLDDITLEESGLDDITLEESGLDDIALDESGFDDISNDLMEGESGIDDELGELDGLLDQAGQDEDIDDEMLALLESVSDSEGGDSDGIDGADFDLFQGDEDENRGAELNDLIAGSDESEETPPENKKKKRERKRGRKKAKGADGDAELQDEFAGKDGKNSNDADESGAETQKKPGFFARFLAYLTESEEDDEIEKETVSLGELSDENQELLAELSDEDKQNGNEKAKEKEEKTKKGKKEKKGKKNKKASSSDEEGGEESEKAKKKRLKKEQKKAAKEAAKAAKAEAESVDVVPDKKLSKKKVTPVILFCATITVVIILLSTVLPSFLQKRDARVAYDMGNYEEAFELLYGKSLDEEDETLLHKSTIIMTMERKLASYRNYQKIADMELEALDALIQGVVLYNELLPQAEEYNVTGEIENIYHEILETLSAQYGLSETDVIVILASEDDATYTKWLTSVVYGISFDDGIGTKEEEEQPETGGMEDILPEEQEIIDGLLDEAVAGES